MFRRTVILAVALSAVAAPATASAAPVTLGQLADAGKVECLATTPIDVLTVQAATAPATPSYTVPAEGVLTSFTTRNLTVPDAPVAGSFRVLRGMSPTATVPFELAGGAATVAARVPVQAGDRLGMTMQDAFCGFLESSEDRMLAGTDVPDGGTFTPEGTFDGARIQMTAVFERDADGDGFGDDTQDDCATDATRQGACDTDLTVSQSVLEPTAPVGGVAMVTARVSNRAAGVADGVRLAQALPPGVELIAATPSQGTCAGTACALGDLAPGESVLVVAGVRVTSAGAKVLSATGSSALPERTPQDNTAATTLTGIAPPAISDPAPVSGPPATSGPAPIALPRTCRVPRLTGLSRSAAKRVLEAATCRLGKATNRKQRKGTTRGTALVRRQSRKAGTELPAGTRVNVVLAKKTKRKAARRRG